VRRARSEQSSEQGQHDAIRMVQNIVFGSTLAKIASMSCARQGAEAHM
jgi:hypothetical protein